MSDSLQKVYRLRFAAEPPQSGLAQGDTFVRLLIISPGKR